jgi:hypothetical protein
VSAAILLREFHPKVTAAQVKTTLPPLSTKTEFEPFGSMDPGDWQSFINWMVENQVLGGPQRAVDALSNELLPGGPVDAG